MPDSPYRKDKTFGERLAEQAEESGTTDLFEQALAGLRGETAADGGEAEAEEHPRDDEGNFIFRVRDSGDPWIFCPWCATFIAPEDSGLDDPAGEASTPGWAAANLHAEEHMDVAPTAAEVEETYVVAPRFAPGDAVQDRDADPADRGTMRVLSMKPHPADEVLFETAGGKEMSIAEFNPEHPALAPVYTCVYEGYLDSNFGGRDEWESWIDDEERGEFPRLVGEHAANWKIPRQTYDYPATRLMGRVVCEGCGERKKYRGHKWACLNPDCPNFAEWATDYEDDDE